MIGRNLDDAEEWVRSWTAQVSARAESAAQLSDRVSRISASASGSDGAVKVTVASTGQVTSLELDDRVQRLPGRELAREILRVMRVAQGRITVEVNSAVSETVGLDSETGRAVLGSYEQRFPVEPSDEDGENEQPHRG